jgi:DNA invertase Pin-like site-specific DNA recombinase
MNYSLAEQTKVLLYNGVPEENIRIEVASAAGEFDDRPVFRALIRETLRPGDTLMVTRIDRCARNTIEFLKLNYFLEQRSVIFKPLDLPFGPDEAVNKLICTTLSSIAEFENSRRKYRQREGIAAAKEAGGKYLGRKSIITDKLICQIRTLREENKLSTTDIAKLTSVSRNTVYKVLREHLNYKSNRLVREIDRDDL